MKIIHNPNNDPNVPYIVDIDSDTRICFEFAGDGEFKDPCTMTWLEFMQRPFILLLVKTSNGARVKWGHNNILNPQRVVFHGGNVPCLPFDGTSLMTARSLGGRVVMIDDVVLDLK